MIREGRLAGVILFAENLPSRAAGRRLIAELQAIRRPPGLRDPLLVMVDQEGGLVKRLAGAPTASAARDGRPRRRLQPRARALAPRPTCATSASTSTWRRCSTSPAPAATSPRPNAASARPPARVAATAVPFATALQGGGVAATGKHFPGFGSARVNTDVAVQRIGLSKAELRRVDEAPYRRFVAAGGEMVMLSTAIYPAFSPKPAAFAPPIATGELRQRLGFAGVSITDALDSVAVARLRRPGQGRARGGPGRHRPAPLHRLSRPAPAPGGPCCAALRSGALRRAGLRNLGRPGPAPAPPASPAALGAA